MSLETSYPSYYFKLQHDAIPLKGFTDLVCEDAEGKFITVDHKLVSTVVQQSELSPAYELQAATTWFLVQKHYGKNPEYMRFDQIKKSKNRDKSPQLVPYIVEYTPELLEAFLELYRRICLQLSGQPCIDEQGFIKFIPNPFGMFDGEKSWDDFKQEIESGKKWNLKDLKTNALNIDDIPLLEL